MSRLSPYLGIVAALVLGAVLVAFSGDVVVSYAPAPVAPTASSTLAVVPTMTLLPLTVPDLEPRKTTATTSEQMQAKASSSTPKKVIIPKPIPKQAPAPTPVPVIAPVAIQAPAPLSPSGSAALDVSASTLRAALVNIICYAPTGTRLHSISGSGVFVDPKGIILTNAHIAQYFLLSDQGVSCTIRAESPAIDKYEASLVYIPSPWIAANATVLTQANPSGTGQYDFALLAVTKPAKNAVTVLPSSFPFIPLAIAPPNAGTPIVIASYGAQFLESNQIQFGLFPTVVFGSVKDVFTFEQNTIDVLALGGSAAAQEGSSGGGVSSGAGELIGTITTSTTEGTTDTRKLDAITASYIRAEYANETGNPLNFLLAQAVATSISDFAPQISDLESILTAQLHN